MVADVAACTEDAGADSGEDKRHPRQLHARMVKRSRAPRNGIATRSRRPSSRSPQPGERLRHEREQLAPGIPTQTDPLPVFTSDPADLQRLADSFPGVAILRV
jgi:hypothetical protein